MSREELREQLARLAEDAPVASVPSDTFRRARRATVRTRVAGAVLAVGCVVLAAALGGQLLDRAPSTPGYSGSASDHPGIPDHVYADESGATTALTDLPRVAAAAYALPSETRGIGVVVDPAGRYARVRLPQLDPAHADAFALSPNGMSLAWYSRTNNRGDTGVNVLHLGGGHVEHHSAAALGVPQGILVTRLSWSPDSRSLLWSGQPVTSWGKGGASYATRQVGGVIDFHALGVARAPTAPSTKVPWADVEVCNDGTLLQEIYGGPRAWRKGRPIPRAAAKAVALETCGPTPALSQAGTQDVLALGRTDDGTSVSLRHSSDSWDHQNVYVGDRAVSWVDQDIEQLSVATGLISSAHPSHHTDRPSWAPRSGHAVWWWVGGGVGFAVLLLCGWGVARRRQRVAR